MKLVLLCLRLRYRPSGTHRRWPRPRHQPQHQHQHQHQHRWPLVARQALAHHLVLVARMYHRQSPVQCHHYEPQGASDADVDVDDDAEVDAEAEASEGESQAVDTADEDPKATTS